MERDELDLVCRLTGVSEDRVALRDDGFRSRGYVADGGRFVFKFPKAPGVRYENEARLLNRLNASDLGVALQRVAWTAGDGAWLGLHGVPGASLEGLELPEDRRREVGQQLGRFLRRLHALEVPDAPVCTLDGEIEAWQRRFLDGRAFLAEHFTPAELARLDRFLLEEAPGELRALGERPVFSHGDLGEGNILLDGGRVGVIDFNESGYFEEAADFMDIQDGVMLEAMLDAYGADAALRRKTAVRRALRPLFVAGTYAGAGRRAEPYLKQVRTLLGA